MSITHDLHHELLSSGYYPELTEQLISDAVMTESIVEYFTHMETTLDTESIRRHQSALVVTETRFISLHVDEVEFEGGEPHVVIATESIPLSRVNSVTVSRAFANPSSESAVDLRLSEVTIAIAWDHVKRIEMEPARCADPHCERDHGFAGSQIADDLVLRISALADGAAKLSAAVGFAQSLSLITGRR